MKEVIAVDFVKPKTNRGRVLEMTVITGEQYKPLGEKKVHVVVVDDYGSIEKMAIALRAMADKLDGK